jgi:hypothetical protein
MDDPLWRYLMAYSFLCAGSVNGIARNHPARLIVGGNGSSTPVPFTGRPHEMQLKRNLRTAPYCHQFLRQPRASQVFASHPETIILLFSLWCGTAISLIVNACQPTQRGSENGYAKHCRRRFNVHERDPPDRGHSQNRSGS